MNKFDFNNKTAVITGGAQGFGLDIAKRFLNSGAKVFIWDIDEELLKTVADEINHSNLSFNVIDVSNFSQIEKTVSEITSKNKIDMCVNLGASDGEVRSRDIFSKIKSWAPEGVDIILDPVGAEYFESNLNVLGIEGRLVIIGLMSGAQTNLNLGHLMIKRQKIIGSTIRARNVETKNIVMEELSQKVLPLFKSGELIPIIHETYPLYESEKAHEIM